VPCAARQHGIHHGADHRHEIGLSQRRSGGAHPPHVHLVRLADVLTVDDVAPVAHPGHAEDGLGRDLANERGDVRTGVRAQHPAAADVAGVAAVTGGGVR
jgi:hypothetical protein